MKSKNITHPITLSTNTYSNYINATMVLIGNSNEQASYSAVEIPPPPLPSFEEAVNRGGGHQQKHYHYQHQQHQQYEQQGEGEQEQPPSLVTHRKKQMTVSTMIFATTLIFILGATFKMPLPGVIAIQQPATPTLLIPIEDHHDPDQISSVAEDPKPRRLAANPTFKPTKKSPTRKPSKAPITKSPTRIPTMKPTGNPTSNPVTMNPTSLSPTIQSTSSPTSISTTHSPTSSSPTPIPFVRGDLAITVASLGIKMCTGMSVKVLARAGQKVPLAGGGTSSINFHSQPDGAGIVSLSTGGYVYVSNSELSSAGGGVYGLYFDSSGNVSSFAKFLGGTTRNCGGGLTPWKTWITCEEFGTGQCWQIGECLVCQ
jgi:hypothetical protein